MKEIGMYHMMKESAVEKAKNRAVEKLREAYPGSRLQIWRAVHRMMRRPVPPPGEDSELRRNFRSMSAPWRRSMLYWKKPLQAESDT